MDVHTPAQRSHNMSRIRSQDTKPELQVRRGLHAAGFRFRLHVADLPGRPDLVFPRYRAVVLVNGCFWHGHNCQLFSMPSTRQEFWETKIAKNQERDRRNTQALEATRWRVLTIWECALKGVGRRPFRDILGSCEAFLRGDAISTEIIGFR